MSKSTLDSESRGVSMDDRIRCFDWKRTSLGPIERWPASLQAIVPVMLASREAMFVWWGDELINLYNDAFATMMGHRHPRGLGQPAERVWREIWDAVGPEARIVILESRSASNGRIRLIRERQDFREETFASWSYSALKDEAGGVGGLLGVCYEETDRVLGDRRLETLRQLADAVSAASNAGEACGLGASALEKNPWDISFSLIYLLDEGGNGARLAASIGLKRGETSAPEEIAFTNENSGSFWPFDRILRGERVKLANLSRLASFPGGAWPEPAETAMAFPLASGAQGRLSGFVVLGASPRLEFDDSYRGFFELVSTTIGGAVARTRVFEEGGGKHDGARRALRESGVTLDTDFAGIQQLQRISSSFIKDDNVFALYDEIVDVTRAVMRSDMASLQRLDLQRHELFLLAQRGFAPESAAFWRWVGADHSTSCGLALARGEQIIIRDVERWDLVRGSETLRHFHLSGIRSVASNPLISRDGRLVGVISAHWRDVHEPSERELRLFNLLARQAADLIERGAAKEALRESQARHRRLFNANLIGIFTVLGDGRILEANDAFLRTVGYTRADLEAGRLNWRAMTPQDELQQELEAAETRIQPNGETAPYEKNFIRSDGATVPVLFGGVFVQGPGGEGVCFALDITERKRNERRQDFLLKLNDALRPLSDPVEVRRAAMRMIGEYVQVDCVFFAEFEPDGGCIADDYYVARAFNTSGRSAAELFPSMIRRFDRGEVLVINDVRRTTALSDAEREAAIADGVLALMGIPLLEGGRLVAQLGFQRQRAHEWTADEMATLKETADRTWAAVDRVRSEAALRHSEKRLRLALDAAEMGSYVWHAAEDRTDADPALLKLFGLPPGAVLTYAGAMATMVHPDDRKRHEAVVSRSLDPNGDGIFRDEIRVRGADGVERWLAFHGRVEFEGDPRRPVRASGVARDVTARHLAVAELRESRTRQVFLLKLNDALREQSDAEMVAPLALRMLADNLGVDRCYMVTLNMADDRADVTYQFVRPGLPAVPTPLKLSNFPECMKHVYERTQILEDIAKEPGLGDSERQALTAMRFGAFIAATLQRGARNPIWSLVVVSAQARRWRPGEVALVREVSERTWAAMERSRAVAAQRRLNESLERRIKERTADLQQQTTRLRQLALELMDAERRERRSLASTLHDGLQQILVAAKMQIPIGVKRRRQFSFERISELLDQAIQVSRSLVYELSPPVLGDFDLPESVQWLAGWFTRNHDFQVNVEVAADFPEVSETSRRFVFDVVRELLLNVVKHAGVYEATVRLRICEGNQLQMEVQDYGKGFDSDHHQYGDRPEGFGLFSIRERLSAVGGGLEIQSAPGNGAQVTIYLPLSTGNGGPETGERLQESGDRIEPAQDDSRGVRGVINIVLVDDHSLVREGIASLIRNERDFALVGEAENGLQAIELVDRVLPHVVLMDIDLPVMDGVEAARRIKRRHPEIHVVGLSIHAEDEKAKAMRQSGASLYIEKDRVANLLFDAIRGLYTNP